MSDVAPTRMSDSLKIGLAGGIGVASGEAYSRFAHHVTEWSFIQTSTFIRGIGLICWLAWRHVEPFWTARFAPERVREEPKPFRLRRYFLTFTAVFLAGTAGEVLVHALSTDPRLLLVWLLIIPLYGVVTYAWAYASSGGRRAVWAGAAAGALVGAVETILKISIGVPLMPGRPTTMAVALGGILGGAFALGIRGFAGGLALDRLNSLPGGVRVMIGLAAVVLPLHLLRATASTEIDTGGLATDLVEILGWGGGLLFYEDANRVFGANSSRQLHDRYMTASASRPVTSSASRPVTSSASRSVTSNSVLSEKVKIAVAGMVGASASILYVIFYQDSMSRWLWWQQALFLAVTGFAGWLTWRFFEPFIRRGLLGPEPQAHEQIGSPLDYWRHFAAVLTTAVLMEFFLQGLTMKEGGGFLLWLHMIPLFGIITYAWVAGATRRPRRAGRWGCIAGVIAGAITLGSVGFFAGLETVFPTAPDTGLPPGPGPVAVLVLAGAGAMTMGLRGYAGGKAIEWLPLMPVGFRVMIGVGTIVILNALLNLSFGMVEDVWVPVAQAVGWGTGLLMFPTTDDFIAKSDQAENSLNANIRP